MTGEDWKTVAAIVGAAIALVTLAKAVVEYTEQGAQKRVDRFLEMRKRFKENQSFTDICALLEHDQEELRNVAFHAKRDFLGFFEEIALLLNSGLIRPEVAQYMFGYYALKCWESEHFWVNVNRDGLYWSVFRDFAKRMAQMRQAFRFERRRFRF
jgi:hypothetical protein